MSTPLTINPFGLEATLSKGFKFEIEILTANTVYVLNTKKPDKQTTVINASANYCSFYGTAEQFQNYIPSIDMIVDWGDQQRSTISGLFEQSKNSHTYNNPGKYIIYITGICDCLDFKNDQHITKLIDLGDIKFQHLKFFGATNLKEINCQIADKNIKSKIFSFDSMFKECINLTFIPTSLFCGITTCSMSNIFENCTSLTFAPAKLFYECSITTLLDIFKNCTNLQIISKDLFLGVNHIYEIMYLFEGCVKLTQIPVELLMPLVELKSMFRTFSHTGITTIPDKLFEKNVNLLKLEYVFASTPITIIPSNLFNTNVKLTSVLGLFAWSMLKAIPRELFKYNPNIAIFTSTFQNTMIVDIPGDLFGHCFSASNFTRTFSTCESLVNIISDPFKGCLSAENFTMTFSYCSNLRFIPDDMFADTVGGGFYFTFSDCYRLNSAYPKLWTMFNIPTYDGNGAPTEYIFRTYYACKAIPNRNLIPGNFK